MSQLTSYVVRLWRNGARTDADVLGVVEELDDAEKQVCETVEALIEALRARRGKSLRRKRTFASFQELLLILESSEEGASGTEIP